jgi:hypothetical protein
MAKRIIAGILGTLAVFGSLLPLGYAFEILTDFKNPDISFWANVLGELFICSIALAGLWVGIRFLRFASSGATVNKVTGGWSRCFLEWGFSSRGLCFHSRSPYFGRATPGLVMAGKSTLHWRLASLSAWQPRPSAQFCWSGNASSGIRLEQF